MHYIDRHAGFEEDFAWLVEQKLKAGEITQLEAENVILDFNCWLNINRFAA